MAGLFFDPLNILMLDEPEPEYVKATPSGMTPDAMFQRYIDISDACVETEMALSAADPDGEADLNALVALLHSVALVAFKPVPALPFFPWKAPAR